MAYRASLRKCIEHVATQLSMHCAQRLAIARSNPAKYYTVFTDQDLERKTNPPGANGHSIVFHGTLNELRQFTAQPQQSLDFTSTAAVAKKTNKGAGQHEEES